MGTIFKIEGVFLNRAQNDVWKLNYILTNKTLDDIKSELLPYYVEDAKHTFGDNYLHHIYVSEIPLDRPIEDDEFIRQYVFLPNGTLYISKEYNNMYGDMCFKGRNENELPLKVGDKVEWFEKDFLHFGVVYSLPPMIGEFEYLDGFDDCYTVLEGIDELGRNLTDDEYLIKHKHVDVGCVFKRE